jgi:hypothetical protein
VVLTPKGVFALDGAAPRRLAAGSEALSLMDELLDGDARGLGRDFIVRRAGTARAWRLSLKPRPGPLASVFEGIEADGGRFAREARLREVSGDRTSIRFDAVLPGPGGLGKAEESLLGP